MGFLKGKRALIIGIASDRSIATGIAEAMHREGAELAFSYQNDRLKDRVESAAKEFGSSLVFLVTGFIMTLKKPAPQPSRANIRYNQLLREQLGRRNQEIARDNAQRRRQVQITATPVTRAEAAR